MDDLELDRELRAQLDVAPSPEFVARVRVRLAATRGDPLFVRWLKPAAAVACVVIVAVAVALRFGPDTAKSTETTSPAAIAGRSTTARRITVPSTTAEPSRLEVTSKAVRRPSSLQRAPSLGGEPAFPEVLISAEDRRAFEQLVASVQERRFEASFEETPESTPWVMKDLTPPPLTIEPLDQTVTRNN